MSAPSSGQCDLEDASLNLRLLREHSVKELSELIAAAGGKEARGKILLLDPNLAGPLGLVVEISILKELGIDKIFYLSSAPLDTTAKHIIYLVRPEVPSMKLIAQQVNGLKAKPDKKSFHLLFTPRRRMICERVLEEANVYEGEPICPISEFHLDFVPFDSDVLSMELGSGFRDCALDGDRTPLFYLAKALMKLQFMYGIIPNIQGKGFNSQFVAEMMFRMRREMASDEPLIVPEIDRVILIDRECDLVTPLCTQLTYEGLIDEVFGVFNSTVDLPAEMVMDSKEKEEKKDAIPPGKKVKTPLNSNNKLFRDIRDLNFVVVGPMLNQKAKQINEGFNERHSAKTVQDIRAFTLKLPILQKEQAQLSIQIKITDAIRKVTHDPSFRQKLEAEQGLINDRDVAESLTFIEDCINMQDPVLKVLRLLALYSLTNGGVPEKTLNFLKREIVQTYGYRYLFTLDHLSKLGMIKPQTRSNNFARVRGDLNLVVENISESDPSDIAYVYSGYAPLSVRLIEKALQCPSPSLLVANERSSGAPGLPTTFAAKQAESKDKEPDLYPGWGDPRVDSVLSYVTGPTFHAQQTLSKGLAGQDNHGSKSNKVTLVVFVGGSTFTEISALRFLSQKREGLDILVATTKMLNGNSILESLFETFGVAEMASSS